MVFYFSIWFLIAFVSFFFRRNREFKVFFYIFLIFLMFFLGLRYEIGADWFNYIYMYEYINGLTLYESILFTDPGYGFLNYISHFFNLKDTILINFVCSFLFLLPFFFYPRKIYNYWIPLLVSFPYLILVVSMGYTRQSVAISFFIIAIIFALENKFLQLFLFSFLAFLFHKSSIIILIFYPIILFPRFFANNIVFYTYMFFSFIFMSIVIFISSVTGENIYTSKSSEISSSGAIFRVLAHILPLIFYIIYRPLLRKILLNKLMLFDCLVYLILFTLFLSFGFSTLADRFNLYLIVFDILVFSYLYLLLNKFNRLTMMCFIILFNTLLLFIWLNFGAWSKAWLPYQNYLFFIL